MQSKRKYIINVGVCFLLLVLPVLLLDNFEITFDAAMNFDVSKNLVKYGEYATFYQKYQLFDHNIQTGGPVIFPTALLNYLFGTRSENMLFINAIYCGGLLILIYFFFCKRTHWLFSLAVVLIVSIIPNTFDTALSGFGEIPMAFWMTAMILLFEKEEGGNGKSFVTGLIFGLGYLTKTVFLICSPALFLIMLYDILYRKTNIKKYLLLALGAVFVICFFELYKLLSLGANEYVQWWEEELSAILGQAGVNDKFVATTDTTDLISRIKRQINLYCEYFNCDALLLIIIYICPVIYLGNQIKNSRVINISELFFFFVSITYFFWWIFMIPEQKSWARRVEVGHIYSILGFAFTAFDFLGKYRKKIVNLFPRVAIIGISGLVLIFAIVNNLKIEKGIIEENQEIKTTTQKMTDNILKMNTEEITWFGIGWWQNPVFAAKADVIFYDLSQWEEIPTNSYFVKDYFMDDISFDELQRSYDLVSVFEVGTQGIYKINGYRE